MFFNNPEAIKLVEWSREESNRIKASHIYRVALRMEERWRKHQNKMHRYKPYYQVPLPTDIKLSSDWLDALKLPTQSSAVRIKDDRGE